MMQVQIFCLFEYDAIPGAFADGGSVVKTDTNTLKTAAFNLCDARFANRDNGADFRISDNGDGAEFIDSVKVIGLPSAGAQTVNVDDFGANPFDNQPDSGAVQALLDSTCSGDTIVFTSGVSDPNYKGYLIDKTLFLTGMSAKHDLTFTSSDPNNHALLKATEDLKGFVIRLYARSRFTNADDVDNIDFGYVDVNGNRDLRKENGSNGIADGKDDNWDPGCQGNVMIPAIPGAFRAILAWTEGMEIGAIPKYTAEQSALVDNRSQRA